MQIQARTYVILRILLLYQKSMCIICICICLSYQPLPHNKLRSSPSATDHRTATPSQLGNQRSRAEGCDSCSLNVGNPISTYRSKMVYRIKKKNGFGMVDYWAYHIAWNIGVSDTRVPQNLMVYQHFPHSIAIIDHNWGSASFSYTPVSWNNLSRQESETLQNIFKFSQPWGNPCSTPSER